MCFNYESITVLLKSVLYKCKIDVIMQNPAVCSYLLSFIYSRINASRIALFLKYFYIHKTKLFKICYHLRAVYNIMILRLHIYYIICRK